MERRRHAYAWRFLLHKIRGDAMNNVALTQAVRQSVKPKFYGHTVLNSKVITYFPDNLVREYARITNTYMTLLNKELAVELTVIRRAIDAERKSMRHDDALSIQVIITNTFMRILRAFERKTQLFGLEDKLESLANLTCKLKIGEWKRAVQKTLGIKLAPRTALNHLAIIQDIDDRLDGRIKSPVRVAAAANQAGIYDGNNMTLTYGADGALVIDSVPLHVDDRVLLTGQTDATQNGIYVVTEPGDSSTAAILTRASDFDDQAEILSGVRIEVDAGTQFGNTTWKLETSGTIIIDTTALTFVMVTPTSGTAKAATTITGDGLETEFNFEHDLGTTDVAVTVRNITSNLEVIVDWKPVDANNVEILFAVAPLNTMSFRVVVIG